MADRGHQVELILREVDRLPTLSPVAARLLEYTDLDQIDLHDVIALIESDVALSATILRLVRSADKGVSERIGSVRQAVVLLGVEAVRTAALGVQVLDLLRNELEQDHPTEEPAFDELGFWKHAIGVACAAELIARERNDKQITPESAFLAGLLHGVGRLVLHIVLPQAHNKAIALAEQRRAPSAKIERALLGLDHHTAGRRLADRWGLPEWVRDVIWFHSQPLQGVPELCNRSLVAIVSLARAWCQKNHIGWSGDFCEPPALRPLAADAGVRIHIIESQTPTLLDRVVERAAILHLDRQTTPELLLQSISRANHRLAALNAELDAQADAGQRRQLVATHIASFLDEWTCRTPLTHTLEQIGASAKSLFSASRCSILWQHEPGPTWTLAPLGSRGRIARTRTLTLPLLDQNLQRSLVDRRPLLARDLVPAAGNEDLQHSQLMHIASDADLHVAILYEAPDQRWRDRQELEPIRAVWASAARTARELTATETLEDQLAAANRALAEKQAELAERESLARLGEMTAGAAHEMNNPLAVIRGRAQLLQSRLDPGDLRAWAESIVEASRDLSALITELNRLACTDDVRPALSDLSEIAHAALARAREQRGSLSEVELVGLQGPLSIVTDRELLAEALSELILNAIEAGPDQKVKLTVHEAPEECRLYLRVEDRGCGMSEKGMRHAFDPFFSEKPAGRQRGLGLARARRCVELLGGRVWLEANAGGGTVACIALDQNASLAPAA